MYPDPVGHLLYPFYKANALIAGPELAVFGINIGGGVVSAFDYSVSKVLLLGKVTLALNELLEGGAVSRT